MDSAGLTVQPYGQHRNPLRMYHVPSCHVVCPYGLMDGWPGGSHDALVLVS